MKKTISFLTFSIILAIFPLPGFPQAGTPDSTFNNDGIAIFQLSLQNDGAFDIAALSDTSLYVCGYLKNSGIRNGFILKLLNNGEPDSTFGTDGRVDFQFFSGFATTAHNLIILPDNKIIVSGQCILTTGNREFFIARYLPDGTPDSSFNSMGYLISSYGPGMDSNWDIAMQPDGKFVLAGKTDQGPDFLFMRVNANGTMDSTFGTNGYTAVSISESFDEYIDDVGVLSDGTIVGAGASKFNSSLYRSVLVKLTPSGTPVPGFGTNGVLVPDLFTGYIQSQIFSMDVRDDTLLLTGYVQNNSQSTFVTKLDSSGNAFIGFGTAGIAIPDIGVPHSGEDIYWQQDGKIYVCGTVETYNSANFILWRFLASGDLDSSFNNTGYVTTDVAEGDDDYAEAVELQPDGKIVVAGYAIDFDYDYDDVALTRYLNDWTPPQCVANFSADPTLLCGGNAVTYADLSYSLDSVIISWQWSFEGGTPASSSVQNPVITYNDDGDYNVQLVVSDGMNTDTLLQTDFIHVENTPEAPGTPAGPTELCSDYSYNYTTTGVAYADEYNWQVIPADAGTFTGDSSSVTFTASPAWTGTFDIRVSAEGFCGTGPLSAPLTCTSHHNPGLFQLSGTGDGGYCEGDPGSELSLDNSDTGVDYELYLDGDATGIIVSGTGSPISFGYIFTEGLYSALGYTDYCAETMTGQVYVHQWDLPGQAGIPAGNEETCDNGSDIYTTEEMEDADGYEWTLDPAEAGEPAPAGDSVIISWNPGFSGYATLSVHGENDCGNGPESDPLDINVSLSPDPVISGPQQVAPGSEEQYQTADNPGNTYNWEVSGGTITEGADTYRVTVLWGNPGEGSVVVTEVSAQECSATTPVFNVTIDESIFIEENQLDGILVYPNPADGEIYISLHSDKAQEVLIRITDLEGKVVYSSSLNASEGENHFRVATANLPQGIYVLKVENHKPFRLVLIH